MLLPKVRNARASNRLRRGMRQGDRASKRFLTTTSDFASRLADDALLKLFIPGSLELVHSARPLKRLEEVAMPGHERTKRSIWQERIDVQNAGLHAIVAEATAGGAGRHARPRFVTCGHTAGRDGCRRRQSVKISPRFQAAHSVSNQLSSSGNGRTGTGTTSKLTGSSSLLVASRISSRLARFSER